MRTLEKTSLPVLLWVFFLLLCSPVHAGKGSELIVKNEDFAKRKMSQLMAGFHNRLKSMDHVAWNTSANFSSNSSFFFSQEICNNGIDDDGDGLIDGADPDCFAYYQNGCGSGAPGGGTVYFIPLPEDQLHATLKVYTDAASRTISSSIHSVTSIVASYNGTIITYDHWEDGYETNIGTPVQSTTRVWGDNNSANGIPPGFATDLINAGSVIQLVNLVEIPRLPSNIRYDGQDFVNSSKPLTISKAAWAPTPGPVLAGAVEIFDTLGYGKIYEIPIGENVSANSMFERTSLYIMAKNDGTIVNIDIDANGTTDVTKYLNKGQNYTHQQGIRAGAKITSNNSIQVHVLTGDIGATFETRWFTMLPTELWDAGYYNPVGTTDAADPAHAFLYNPGTSSIQVSYKTVSSAGTFTVPAKGVYTFVMPMNSGANFYTTNGSKFFGICTIDSDSDNSAHDWGFTLMPKSFLTTSVVVGWGPGSDGLTENGNPAWVTSTTATTVYVDYDGNPATGPLTDPSGNKYNVSANLAAYESKRFFDPDKDQTGMRIYTLNGALLAGAWGQDPANSLGGNPFLDLGTSLPPARNASVWKEHKLVTDNNSNGKIDGGDLVTYSIILQNPGSAALCDIMVFDTLPAGVTYVPNSTKLNTLTISDNISPKTPFPCDENGFYIPFVRAGKTDTLSFRVSINSPATNASITNTLKVTMSNPPITIPGDVTFPVVIATSTNCSLVFTNSSGTTQTVFQENTQVCLTLTDGDQNRNSSTIETSQGRIQNSGTGDWENITLTETGVNTGIFRGCINSSSSTGQSPADGILYSRQGNSLDGTSTDPFNGETCTNIASVTAPSKTKFLYLTSPGQGLDRIDPVATADNSTANSAALGISGVGSASTTFTQNAPMCSPLTLPAGGALNFTSYITVSGTPGSVTKTISQSSDDIEEVVSGGPEAPGYMFLTSPDIEMVDDVNGYGYQKVGLRFNTLTIPQGATITNAYLTFKAVDPHSPSTNSGATNLTIKGQASDNAGTFTTSSYNLSNRATTSANVSWSPGSWTTGTNYNSPNLSSIVQEIVNRSGWASSNSMVFVVTGTGYRSAYSYDASPANAAKFTVEYTSGTMPSNPNISTTLKYGSTNFATLTNPTYNSGTGILQFSGTMAGNTTIPAGQAVAAVVTTAQTGVSFVINYDSQTKPSKISLPTTTVIKVEEFQTYNAAYPGGSIVNSAVNGDTIYLRATVSDPFGHYDITSADLIIKDPGGSTLVNTTLSAPNVVSASGCTKIYEYKWFVPLQQGQFKATIIAREGYENINDSAQVVINVSYLDIGTPCYVDFVSPSGAPVGLYAPNGQICMWVKDIDENRNSTIVETVNVVVVGAGGDSEVVTLTETSANTGIFMGCVNSSATVLGTVNNGTLYAPAGTTILFSYSDANDVGDLCVDEAIIQASGPGVSINKRLLFPVDGRATVGESIAFEIVVTNPGTTNLTTVSLTDNFPSGCMTYSSASTNPSTVGSGTLTWNNIGPIAPGGNKKITVYFTASGSCNPATNTASTSAVDQNAVVVNAGPVTATVIITKPLLAIDKYIYAPGPAPYFLTDTLTYWINLTNTGSTSITSLPLWDTYNNNCMQFISSIPVASGTGGGSIYWNNLGPLLPGALNIVTVRFKVLSECKQNANEASVNLAVDIYGDYVPPVSDVDISRIESPPIAVKDNRTTPKNTDITISVLANDIDADGNIHPPSVTTTGLVQPANGSTSIIPLTGQIIYSPNFDFYGVDSFQYKVCDLTNLCSIAWVVVQVNYIAENCTNGIDDDNDGYADCLDPECGIISVNAGADQAICAGATANLTAIGSGSGNYTYAWNQGLGSGASKSVTPVVTTDYTVTVTGAYGCTATDQVRVVLRILPTAYAGADVSTCPTDSTTISASGSGGNGPYTYAWSHGLGSGQTKKVLPSSTTTYFVTVTGVYGCSATDDVTITIAICDEICTNGLDDDGDGLVDCADPDCALTGAPVLVNDVYNICPGITNFQEQVSINDRNFQSPVFSLVTNPTKGNVTLSQNGTINYTLTSSACGTDQFFYRVCNQVSGCCSEAKVTIILGDTIPPMLINVPADITVSCDDILPTPPLVYGMDSCPGIYLSYNQSDGRSYVAACSDYEITRTWVAQDLCGNQVSESQIITVEDNSGPELFRVYTLSNGKKLIAGRARQTSHLWKNVSFPTVFSQTPLLFTQVITNNELAALTVRTKNITTAGFDLFVQEEENADKIHAPETVAWLAIEPGALSDITNLKAVLVDSVNSNLKTLNFASSFLGLPAFIASTQTYQDADPIAVRYTNRSSTSIQVFLQEEQSKDTEVTHGFEKLAYIAVEPGAELKDTNGDFIGETGAINLSNAWKLVTLKKKYNTPIVILGGLSINDSEASTIRVRNITATSFEVKLKEWDYLNGTHPNETASYIVIEGNIPTDAGLYCGQTPVNLIPGVNIFARDNCERLIDLNHVVSSSYNSSGMVVNNTWSAVDDCDNIMLLGKSDTCQLAALKIKATLLGALINNGGGTLMRDDLRKNNRLPAVEPYSGFLEFLHVGGGGGETVVPGLFNITGNDAIVDWVFIEIRSLNNPVVVLATKSALLQRDGDVVNVNGEEILVFPSLEDGDYYVSIRHRNHLGLATDYAWFLSTSFIPVLDFRDLSMAVRGSDQAGRGINNKRAMWSGDLNGDGICVYQGPHNDVFHIFSRVLSDEGNVGFLANYIASGYLREDLNLDGRLIYQGPNNDRSILLYHTILAHPGNPSLLANFLVLERLP